MDKFVIRNHKPNQDSPYASTVDSCQPQTKLRRVELNLDDLPNDPGLRRRISDYNPNDKDHTQIAYLQKDPCQPANHKFSQTLISGKLRRFNSS